MKVCKRVEFDKYWSDPRFRKKRPLSNAGVPWKCGDNIY